MKTILFVHASDELYGSDRCLLAIVRGLPSCYRAIVVLPADVPHPGPLTHELTACGATILKRRMLVLRRNELQLRAVPSSLLAFLLGIVTLARIVRSERVTLVHSNTVAAVCGVFAALIMRKPHLWHVHEFLGDEPFIVRVPLRLLLRRLPGLVVANSQATARSIGSPRTRVVHNAVFVAIDGDRIRTNPPVIGVVGRLSPRKGVAEALQAAAMLALRGLEFRLTFTGDAPPGQQKLRAEYEQLAHELGIDSITTFTGETCDPAAAYLSSDILLVPSQRPEPFGLAIVEGMAAGCAVVATRNGGGSDEILIDGVTGLYCGRDPGSISDALQRVIEDSGFRAELAENARRAARERYNADRYVMAFLQTYSELQA